MTKYSLWGVKKVIQTIKYGFLIDKSRGVSVFRTMFAEGVSKHCEESATCVAKVPD